MISLLFFSSLKQYCITNDQDSCPNDYHYIGQDVSAAITTINQDADTRVQLAIIGIEDDFDLASLTTAVTIYVIGQGETNTVYLSLSTQTTQTILISNCVVALPDSEQQISVKSLSLSSVTFSPNTPSSITCSGTLSIDSAISNQIPSTVTADKIIVKGTLQQSLTVNSLTKVNIQSPGVAIEVNETTLSYGTFILKYANVPELFEVSTGNNFKVLNKAKIPLIRTLTVLNDGTEQEPVIDIAGVFTLIVNRDCTISMDYFNNTKITNSTLTLTQDITCELGVVGFVLKNSSIAAANPVTLTLNNGRFEIREKNGEIATNVNIIGTDIGLFVHNSVAIAMTTELTIRYYQISFELYETDSPSLQIKKLKLGNRELNNPQDMQLEYRPAEWRYDWELDFDKKYPVIIAQNDDFCPAEGHTHYTDEIVQSVCSNSVVTAQFLASPRVSYQEFNYLATNERDPEFHPISCLGHASDFATPDADSLDIIMDDTVVDYRMKLGDFATEITVKGGAFNIETSRVNQNPTLYIQDTTFSVAFEDPTYTFVNATLTIVGTNVIFDDNAKIAIYKEATLPLEVFVNNGLSIDNFLTLHLQLTGTETLEFNQNGWKINDLVLTNVRGHKLVLDYLDCINSGADLTVTTTYTEDQIVAHPIYINNVVHSSNINLNLNGNFGKQVYFYVENTQITFLGSSSIIPVHYEKGQVLYEDATKVLTADMDNDATILYLNGTGITSKTHKVTIEDFEIPSSDEETRMVFENAETNNLSFEDGQNIKIRGLKVLGDSKFVNTKALFDNVAFQGKFNTSTDSTLLFYQSPVSEIDLYNADSFNDVTAFYFIDYTEEEVKNIKINTELSIKFVYNSISYTDPFISDEPIYTITVDLHWDGPTQTTSSSEIPITSAITTDTTSKKSKLKAGAIIGISVGSVVLLVVIIIVVVVLLIRRKPTVNQQPLLSSI